MPPEADHAIVGASTSGRAKASHKLDPVASDPPSSAGC
jgi:hypothetical protein